MNDSPTCGRCRYDRGREVERRMVVWRGSYSSSGDLYRAARFNTGKMFLVGTGFWVCERCHAGELIYQVDREA